jgi:uncharacterized protein (DUF1330 family)
MPKGYLYAESEVVDSAEFERYREKSAPVSASFGGRYVVRRSEPVVLDGEWSRKRVVMIEFDSPQLVRAFYDLSHVPGHFAVPVAVHQRPCAAADRCRNLISGAFTEASPPRSARASTACPGS